MKYSELCFILIQTEFVNYSYLPELLRSTFDISMGFHSNAQHTNDVNKEHKIYLKAKTAIDYNLKWLTSCNQLFTLTDFFLSYM